MDSTSLLAKEKTAQTHRKWDVNDVQLQPNPARAETFSFIGVCARQTDNSTTRMLGCFDKNEFLFLVRNVNQE